MSPSTAHSAARPVNDAPLPIHDGDTHANDLSLWLDGRIDNEAALAAELHEGSARGPELILRAYRRWGDDFPRHIAGDFAIALRDVRGRRILLARDPGGHRPLHYWSRGDDFRFAGHARELLARGDIPMAIDENRVAHWLSMLPERTGATFFKGISVLRPGCMAIHERGRTTIRDFWRPESVRIERHADPREYAEGLRDVLRRAVEDRIAADSHAGSHLSGGLDSSSVTATAARILGERGGLLTAFTAVPSTPVDAALFPGRLCDESGNAAATAAMHANIHHVLIPTDMRGLFDVLDRMSAAAECPQLNAANSVWFHAICGEARLRGIHTMLTGGNGNFTISWDGRGALRSLLASGRMDQSAKLAAALRREGSTWRELLAAGLPIPARAGIRRLRRTPAVLVEDYTGLRAEFAHALGVSPCEAMDCADMLDSSALRIWSMRRYDPGGHIAALRHLTGIEQTDPTADRRVIDYCLSVPEEEYRREGVKRSLIRDAMADMLPAQVLREKRIGRQSADFVHHLGPHRNEIAAELRRLETSDLAPRCIDLPRLRQLVVQWPAPPFARDAHNRYGTQLMRAISTGRFIRRVEEGSLFAACP